MGATDLKNKEGLSKKQKYNTTVDHQPFSEELVEKVWQKGEIIHARNPSEYRMDICGAIMDREEYGNKYSLYGWEIDHILPTANGGNDDLSNLQPLRWQNNRFKGDNYPAWTCKIPVVKTITQ